METTRDGRPSQNEALGVIALTLVLAVALFIFAKPAYVESYSLVGDSIKDNEVFADFYAEADPAAKVACLINIHSDYLDHPGVSAKKEKNGGSITLTGQTVNYQFPQSTTHSIVVNGRQYDLSADKFLDAYINPAGQLTITQKSLSDADAQTILRYLAKKPQA